MGRKVIFTGDGAADPAAPRAAQYLVQSVAKTVAILDAFQNAEALSLAQLAQRTGMPKPSVFRLAATLESVGFLDRDPNGSYVLGLKLVSLARVPLSRTFPRTARSIMEDLHRAFGQTVNLAVLDEGEMQFVDILESRGTIRMAVAIGAREPLHATAVGKAVAAELPPQELAQILGRRPLRRLTPNTVTSRPRLDKELELARARGYATDLGECYVGAHCVGAAIFNRYGVFGGISISAPAGDLPPEEFPTAGAAVREAAGRISELLGAGPARQTGRKGSPR